MKEYQTYANAVIETYSGNAFWYSISGNDKVKNIKGHALYICILFDSCFRILEKQYFSNLSHLSYFLHIL